MLSRIADSLFWLNRYMERADGLLRMVSTHYTLSLDKDVNGHLSWKPLLEIFTHADPEEVALSADDTETVLKRLLTDATNTNSLKIIVNKARENARGVQDHITKEVWEQVNQMYHLMNQPQVIAKLNAYEALEVMELFTRQTVLYSGITDITMSRGTGWYFMNLGKYIERCLQTLSLIEKQFEAVAFNVTDAGDMLHWRYLLLSLSGYELHLKNYRSSHHTQNVLQQVLFDENFTRSVIYSLSRIDIYLNKIVGKGKTQEETMLLKSFGRLYSNMRFMDIEYLDNTTLQEFLTKTRRELLNCSRQLVQHFFSYS